MVLTADFCMVLLVSIMEAGSSLQAADFVWSDQNASRLGCVEGELTFLAAAPAGRELFLDPGRFGASMTLSTADILSQVWSVGEASDQKVRR